MKPYLDPALTPIEDDLSESYVDESNILADFLEVSESISHDNDTNVTAENDTHSLLHLQKIPTSQVNKWIIIKLLLLLIINQFLLQKKKKLGKKKRKRKSNIQYKFKCLSYP